MTGFADKLRPGEALAQTCRANETRRNRVSNARANKAAERELVYGGDLTAAQLVARHRALKAESEARRAA